MDTISEERIDKRVIKHDKNMFADKISYILLTRYQQFLIVSNKLKLIKLYDFSMLSWSQMLCLST